MSRISLDFTLGTASKRFRYGSNSSPSPLSPSTIESPIEKATVNAVLTSLSPQKLPSRCFQGEQTDGDTVIPILGFDQSQRQKLQHYLDDHTPLTLQNCQISLNKVTGKYQIIIKLYTSVEKSSVNYHITDPKTLGSPMITLSDLDNKAEYDRVTLQAKVITVNNLQVVSTGKTKQDVDIADNNTSSTITLWEDDVGVLKPTLSYQFNRVQVHKFNGKTTLSLPNFGASIDEISDIGYTVNNEESGDNLSTLDGVTIQAGNQCEEIFPCTHCKKTTAESGEISTCTYCSTTQRVSPDSTVYTAHLYLCDAGGTLYTLRAYTEVLSNIVSGNTISPCALLEATPFSLTYNNFSIIKSVSRPAKLEDTTM